MGAETPEDMEATANKHKVGRTIVTCRDSYKVYRKKGEDEVGQGPTHEVYRTIKDGYRKTSVTPPLLLCKKEGNSKSHQSPTRDAPPAYSPLSLRVT